MVRRETLSILTRGTAPVEKGQKIRRKEEPDSYLKRICTKDAEVSRFRIRK